MILSLFCLTKKQFHYLFHSLMNRMSPFFLFLFLILLGQCHTTPKPQTESSKTAIASNEGNAKVEVPPAKEEPFFIPAEPAPALNLHKIFRQEDWNRVQEGFLNPSTYQVKVSSLKTNRDEAIQEVTEVAKRKTAKMLQSEVGPNPSAEAKVEIKILVEEFGRLVAESDLLGEKRLYVFQVKRPALEIIIKEKLK